MKFRDAKVEHLLTQAVSLVSALQRLRVVSWIVAIGKIAWQMLKGRGVDMIKAVRAVRPRILDSGVKLAVENHGGDLQAREMKGMIEAIGADVMGVCLDSGNPVWMLEDPHFTLETLVPYALTCHVRDSAV